MKECWDVLRNLWKKYKAILWLIIFFIIIVVGVFSINCFELLQEFMNESSQEEITAWLAFISGIAAMAVALVAWFKAGDFYTQNETNFLLHIDERWGSSESIKARIAIHSLYIKVKAEKLGGLKNIGNKAKDGFIQKAVAQKIIELSESKDSKKQEDFIYILNFLDFMETIGYLEEKGRVTASELDALCGESILFNYNILKPYITHKREKHGNDDFYTNFEKLVKKLKKPV